MSNSPCNVVLPESLAAVEPVPERIVAVHPDIATNLIINFLPLDFKESELRVLFEEVGPIESVRIMKNRKTAKSKGYGFVKFAGHDDAKRAIKMFNGKSIHGKQIKVAFSRPGGTRTHCNLFVSNLPKKWDTKDLSVHFGQFGKLLECRVLKNHNGESRRCGFVRFDAAMDAQQALKSMDGYLPKNARSSINVKLAERPSHDKKKYDSKTGEGIWSVPVNPPQDGAPYFPGAGGERLRPMYFEAGAVNGKNMSDVRRMYGSEIEHSAQIGINNKMGRTGPVSHQPSPGPRMHPHAASAVHGNSSQINAMNRMYMNSHAHLYPRPIAMTPPPMPQGYLATSPTPNAPFLAGQIARSRLLSNSMGFNHGGFPSGMIREHSIPVHPEYLQRSNTTDTFPSAPVSNGVNYSPGVAEVFDGPMLHHLKPNRYVDTPSPPPSQASVAAHNMRIHMQKDTRQTVPVSLMTPEGPMIGQHVAVPKGVGKDTIFMSGLPPVFDEDAIRGVCLPYGEIKMVTLQRDNTGNSLGMAFVSFIKPRHAQLAVHSLNGTMMYNSKVIVRL